MSLTHRLRSYARLAAFLSIGMSSNAAGKAAGAIRDEAAAAALARAQRLSRRLTRALGVRTFARGTVPGGPLVLVANHRSYADVPILTACAPSIFLAKAEIAAWPVVGTTARLARTVFVVREDRDSRKAALASLEAWLRQGERVMVFPEGTTTAGPGIGTFRPGVFRLAADLGVPVVPAAIHYGEREDAWTGEDTFVRHFLERFGRRQLWVGLSFGPPLRGSDPVSLLGRTEAWITGELETLERDLAWEIERSRRDRGRSHVRPRMLQPARA